MMNKVQAEKQVVKIGFNALTDCASIVMAAVLGFDEKYGIKIVPSKESSWASVRDKLLTGELDAAHALYGMVYGTQLGIGSTARDMAVLMNLNRNGQAITLSRRLAEQGATDGATLAKLMAQEPRTYTFAQTFPTGTHAMWLHYWLAAHGIDPLRDVRAITVPPAQMVPYLKAGHMDGFCAGEPWNHQAIMEGVGITAATSQQIWPEHPEKVLAASRDFVRSHPNTSRAMIAAVLEASRWIDASSANRMAMAEIISSAAYVNTGKDAISQRILGHYQDGMGNSWEDAHALRFHHEGAVNFPYLSDGMWFMTQQRRWGLLKSDPDYHHVASAVQQTSLYKEAAEWTETPVPQGVLRSSTLMDGKVWDGRDPARYAASFAIRQ
ncbi:CmpA/NrtA family ABC transporter substrate-binding protein [Pseudoduganella ginsengisoli]|uniref:Nitrate ABC transporter substrate-binding protein n=1 Tax=Pseudoduganella ginsengisoli TaxID=1462440 RepID=A0A6L6PVG1_9BURK|nr:CmpA/NrtA family ABC transporter substrate-binding protein [Pseudoduganella ginsengisoli]MTW01201.1 nitrate ABC transporter substrate-binding protein [Pseudoduganella ginsengisoli]